MQGQKAFKKKSKMINFLSSNIVYASAEAMVKMRFTHVSQLETPRFGLWQLKDSQLNFTPQAALEPLRSKKNLQQQDLLLQLNALQQQDLPDVNGPNVQMLNIGVTMMGGNLTMVFSVFLMPIDITNAPNA